MAKPRSKISKNWTVTIPAHIRHIIGLRVGNIVTLTETTNGILVRVHNSDMDGEVPVPNADTIQAINDSENVENLEIVSSVDELLEDDVLYFEAESRMKTAGEIETISHEQMLTELGISETDLDDADVDLSDLPELDESMFSNAKIRLPKHKNPANDDK